MSEDEYIAAIGARWPSDAVMDGPSVETIQLADEAVGAFPSPAKLWVMRGDLLQLADVETGSTLEEMSAAIGLRSRLTRAQTGAGCFATWLWF